MSAVLLNQEFKMKKIIVIFFFITTQIYASANDSINLAGTVDPYCEVYFNPQPVASNLDLTTSQTSLLVTDFYINTNTDDGSSPWSTTLSIDISDHLTHSNGVNIFSFVVDVGEQGGAPEGAWPGGSLQEFPSTADSAIALFLNYTGLPALSLVQGVYSTQWYASCSIEPRA